MGDASDDEAWLGELLASRRRAPEEGDAENWLRELLLPAISEPAVAVSAVSEEPADAASAEPPAAVSAEPPAAPPAPISY